MKTPEEVSAVYSEKLVEYRRYLHAYPELTNQERETSAWIREKLRDFGIPVRDGISGNSVVGVIDGDAGGPCVAFRGDMDALPVFETNDVPYKSTRDGIMHACGHDAHTAILLCLAEVLAAHRELIKGRVLFLFQQGEEGGGGAEKLVAEGAADGVDAAFGLHVGNMLPVGTVAMSAGTQTASSDSFLIRIHGRGTHGATPHLGINPIAAGCAIVTELMQLGGRMVDPLEPCVVSVCQFTAGNTANVIPGEAEIKGTVRCFSDETRAKILSQIENVCRSVCAAHGCTCDTAFDFITPGVVNAERETRLARAAIETLGYTVIDQTRQTISEDFAYISRKVPACFFSLGTGNPGKNLTASNHSSNFDIDENGLRIGLECFLSVYLKFVSIA